MMYLLFFFSGKTFSHGIFLTLATGCHFLFSKFPGTYVKHCFPQTYTFLVYVPLPWTKQLWLLPISETSPFWASFPNGLHRTPIGNMYHPWILLSSIKHKSGRYPLCRKYTDYCFSYFMVGLHSYFYWLTITFLMSITYYKHRHKNKKLDPSFITLQPLSFFSSKRWLG